METRRHDVSGANRQKLYSGGQQVRAKSNDNRS